MKNLVSLLRHRIFLLALAAGASSAFTGCVIEEERRPHHHGYYERNDRRDYRDSRYDDRGPRYRDSYYRDTRPRGSSATVYGDSGTSVTIRRDAPAAPRRTYYYDR